MRLRLLCCAVPLLAACWGAPTAPEALGEAEWETVLALPGAMVYGMASSPDGAIFLALFDGSIWRGGPGRAWDRIATTEELHLTLYAPSGTTLFAAAGARIFRWDAGTGLREEDTPVPKETTHCGDFRTSERIEALWGRGADDVYAVGQHGLIVHYDGAAWRLEPNPLRDAAPSLCYQAFPTDLLAVGGNDSSVFAAGGSVISRGATRPWATLPAPMSADSGGFIRAVAGRPDGAILAGSAFGSRSGSGYWGSFIATLSGRGLAVDRDLAPRLRPLRAGGTAGRRAVFWGFDRDVVVADPGRTRAYRVSHVARLRGAVPVGRDVYIAHYRDSGDTAFVARRAFR